MSSTIHIPDSFTPYPLDCFAMPKFYTDELEGVVLPSGMIRDRTKRLAQEIIEHYGNEQLMVVGVLNGCYRFYYELVEEMKNFQKSQIFTEFVRMKSYVNSESKEIQISINDDVFSTFKGQHVLLVEDIIDTGKSMLALLEILRRPAFRPSTIKVVCLVQKRNDRNKCNYRSDFVGFTIPDVHIVGCAFDYNNRYRDLPHACVLKDDAKKKFSIGYM